MSRSRDLANLANNASGLETLTVSDITDLTATATELNKLDGVTATTGELNLVDGSVTGPLSHRNMIINGAMMVDQRNGGALRTNIGATDNDYRTVDRWRNNWTGGEATRNSLQQVAITDLAGFSKAMKIDCVVAEGGTQDADESFKMMYRFEGQDLQGMEKGFSSAKPVTVSFWVKGTAKTYMLELHQAKSTARHATQQFSVTTSWVRHSYTFPGDTTNTIDCDNAEGLELNIWLFAGSNYTSGSYTSKTWANVTAANRAVGISDSGKGLMNSTSDEVYFTGFQMEIGSQETPFEHRSYADELARCQRYFFRSGGNYAYEQSCGGATVNTSHISGCVFFPVSMRASPTLEVNNVANFRLQSGNQSDPAHAITLDVGGINTAMCNFYQSGTDWSIGNACKVINENNANASLDFKAEL
tara:strand:+ start:335 stop:1582 length:1248 start_codon:yes stop_codon:yes gene_type:complete